MLQLTLQPTLRLMLQQTLQPMLLVMPPIMQPTLLTSRGMSPHIHDTMWELSLPWSRPIVLKEASVTVYEIKWR
jgi:hypothetical protein